MFYTYILYSESHNKFYKGHSVNVYARLKKHNGKEVLSTKYGAPWILIWFTQKKTRKESSGLEKKLKNLTKDRLIAFMLKYKSNVVNQELLESLHQKHIKGARF
ncbi:GIY-YIG nuclease family protein [Spongiivirga sp. MCCC 1A20706]|uniref:GIY-YIG nuclease family protein n=1 Tax=Spongiivirga sp. MCCC 1A20706 TaxID=3160963 RepID=UPI003977B1E0